MTNNQLKELANSYSPYIDEENFEDSNLSLGVVSKLERQGYEAGFKTLSTLITNHLKSLPLDQMTGKQVEESLWNEFLHIQ